MNNLIRTLRIPKASQSLDLTYPEREGVPHCINLICGKNNTGKTYILRRVREALQGEWEGHRPKTASSILLEMSNPDAPPPSSLYLGKTWREKAKAGIVDLSIENQKRSLPGDVPDYKTINLLFTLQQLRKHLYDVETVDEVNWINSPPLRQGSIHKLKLETRLYRCNENHNAVRLIEEILDATLYFRKAQKTKIEYVLVFGDGFKLPYGMWSEGQQSVFYIAVLLEHVKPDILLLDEVENHFHPAFISQVLDLCRKWAKQTLIATHHPHVIFSEYIDRIYYLETNRPSRKNIPEERLEYEKQRYNKAPEREVHNLNDCFKKMTATYRLFDYRDTQLLKQAAQIRSEVDLTLYHALLCLFSNEPASGTSFSLPDRQTQQLIEFVQSSLSSERKQSISLLEFGSGTGRLAREMAKVSSWKLGAKVKWYCWEPYPEYRESLSKAVINLPIDVSVPDSLNEISPNSLDLGVLANVLHEVTPIITAEIMGTLLDKLQKESGKVVILEIEPLLAPEKYAVPYPEETMLELLNDLGFRCQSRRFEIKGAHAYCVIAKKKEGCGPHTLNQEKILQRVEQTWGKLLKNALNKYDGSQQVANYDDYCRQLGIMSTIASINCWKEGLWK